MIEGDNQQKLLLNRPRTGVAASVSSYTWCGLPSSSSLSQTTPALVCGLQQLAYTLAAQQAQERGPQLLRGLYTLAAQQAQERGPQLLSHCALRAGCPRRRRRRRFLPMFVDCALVCGQQHARLLTRGLYTLAAQQAQGEDPQLLSHRALDAGCPGRRSRLLPLFVDCSSRLNTLGCSTDPRRRTTAFVTSCT